MSELTRFSVSLDKELLDKFDGQIESDRYPTRSKAIADLIRSKIVAREWVGDGEVAGAIIIVYDHHKHGLTNSLTSVQHEYYKLIISSQHVHLDHDNCLEIVVVKGDAREIEALARALKVIKGVKHSSLSMATTGTSI